MSGYEFEPCCELEREDGKWAGGRGAKGRGYRVDLSRIHSVRPTVSGSGPERQC